MTATELHSLTLGDLNRQLASANEVLGKHWETRELEWLELHWLGNEDGNVLV